MSCSKYKKGRSGVNRLGEVKDPILSPNPRQGWGTTERFHDDLMKTILPTFAPGQTDL